MKEQERYSEAKEERDCLGVWVITGSIDAPHANGDGEVHLNYGDIVFWDDSGWFVCADGLIVGTTQLAASGNWHRVSQWTVYSDFHRGMITLIDRSK